MRALVFLCMWAVMGPPALAADGSGEARRLTEQLQGFIDRGAYPAAARTYRALEALDGVELTSSDLFMGAEAARATGNMLVCRERLLVAFKMALEQQASLDERARAWLAELQNEYGHITVSSKGVGVLTPAMQPFQADRRAAITFASEQIAAEGRFSGLVPAGEYTWGKSTFTVEKGTEPVKVKVKGPRK
ncbi:MAG: hypothetical protein AB8H79_10620 [Myxococcota bacterium]